MNWKSGKDAPKGHHETRERTVKGKPTTYQHHVPDYIIGAVGKYVKETYWIPPGTTEGGKKGRWHWFNQGTELEGYMDMPKHGETP